MADETLGQQVGRVWHTTELAEPQFRNLLEKLPVAAYTCDPTGLITFFNKHAVEIWGHAPKLNDPADRFCGSYKLYAADGTPIAHDRCWVAQALQTGEECNGAEINVERKDGTRLTAIAHANPIHDRAGNLLGTVNILIDVTDRRRGEEAHRLLASIVESSDDAIVSKTLDGRILSWNAGAERLFGYTAEEAIGSHITIIIPSERLDEETSILSRLRRGERIEHYETIRQRKDGRRVNISVTISPIRDASGRLVAASKVARDISDRKAAEVALLRLKDELATQLTDLTRLHDMSVQLATTFELEPILEETLRTAIAIEGAQMGLLSLCEPDQQYLKAGASVGFRPDTLKELERVPPGGGACGTCFQQRRRIIVEDIETDPIFADYRQLARDAGIRAVHSTPLLTRGGEIVGVLSTHFHRPHRPSDREKRLIDLCARQAVDFIENARLYAQLREADRRKDEFLAVLAHELRNPLAPIANALHLLRLSDDLDPTTEHVREIMERQVNLMVRLVDDLLEVSRITRGKVELRKERVDLVAVVGNAVETSRPAIDAAGHQLAISMPAEELPLDADPVRLAQVIANLLNNAAKYTPHGGQIWLTGRREGSDAVVSVRDTGVGIPPHMVPRVFEMFTQMDTTLDRAQGGLGIGLTLAKSLVQLHGGRIEAHSEGVGQGSEFTVRLPLAEVVPPRTANVAGAPAKTRGHTQLPPRKILLVDDSPAAAYTMGKLLERMGQHVFVATDPTQALATARAHRPAVIISDIGMPDMNGYELARQIRQEPELERVCLVALTGYGQDSDREQAQQAGFDHHLVKPVGLKALEELLRSLPEEKGVGVGESAAPLRESPNR